GRPRHQATSSPRRLARSPGLPPFKCVGLYDRPDRQCGWRPHDALMRLPTRFNRAGTASSAGVNAMFVRNSWYVAGWAEDFKSQPVGKAILRQKVVLFRTPDGVKAVDNLCPHRFVPLSLGTVVDGTLQCAYHGLRFDGNGSCVQAPGQNSIPRTARVQSYPTHERWR